MYVITRSVILLHLVLNSARVDGGALSLTNANIDQIIADNQLVLINFYAEWCRFSNMLSPIWDESADKLAAEMPDVRVVIGKVDCDRETELSNRYHVSKYPTIKYIQNGHVSKKEYRGQRSADSILEFVREQIKVPVKEWNSRQNLLDQLDGKKHHVIGYFQDRNSERYNNFERVARLLKDDCDFLAGYVDSISTSESEGEIADTVHYRPSTVRTNEKDDEFSGNIDSYEELKEWVTEKCSPLVREITFENAEELTEEGIPFLILFHDTSDTDSVKEYYEIVKTQLMPEKGNVNFLTADGNQFAHPLHHLGKSKADLPLIAIDSFRHMYLFPKFEDARIPGKLKRFIEDLHSGKLHREFHYGPDPVEEVQSSEDTSTSQEASVETKTKDDDNKKDEEEQEEGEVKEEVKHFPRPDEDDEKDEEDSDEEANIAGGSRQSTDPPESQFVLLGPSRNRYTILKDEF